MVYELKKIASLQKLKEQGGPFTSAEEVDALVRAIVETVDRNWGTAKNFNYRWTGFFKADKGRFSNVDPKLLLELEQRLRLVFDAHETVLNSQLACPHLSGTPLPATEEGDFDSCLLQQTNPKTVPYIKPFG